MHNVKYQLLRFLCLPEQFRSFTFKRIIENQRRQHECCAARMRRDIHRKVGGNSMQDEKIVFMKSLKV
jgi:hypothetical protein